MNYPLYIARHLSLRSNGRGTTPAVFVASIAVALSVIIMISAIAIVTGFKNEIVKKVIGFNADIQIYIDETYEGESNILSLSPTLEELLNQIPEIEEYSLQVSVPAVFKTDSDFKGIYMRSISDSTTANFLQSNLIAGQLPSSDKREVIISRNIADKLSIKPGDRLDTYFFSDDIRVRPLIVSGVFNTHFDSYDEVTAYSPINLLQGVSSLDGNQGSWLKVSVKNFEKVDEIADYLQLKFDEASASGLLPAHYKITTAHKTGAAYFQWLSLLDTNVIVILTLMLIVGCVTLIGGMLMIILDKKSFIGLLKALGAPNRKIRKIFIFLAIRVALVGLLIGNSLAICLLWAQDKWHFLSLDPESYYIDFVPVSYNWLTILILNIGVVFIIYLSLIIPSRFVTSISPSDTMRYE